MLLQVLTKHSQYDNIVNRPLKVKGCSLRKGVQMDLLFSIVMVMTVFVLAGSMTLVVVSAWRRQKYELAVSVGLFNASLGLVVLVFGELLYLEIACLLIASGMAFAALATWAKLRTVPKD